MLRAQNARGYAVDDAQEAGFIVYDDYAVQDPTGENPAGAQAAADSIYQRAKELVGVDTHVGDRIAQEAGDLDGLFNEPVGPDGPHVQLVDDPEPIDPNVGGDGGAGGADNMGPTGQDVFDVVRKLPRGSRDNFAEIRSEADLRNLWEWATQHATDSTGNTSYNGTQRTLSDGTLVCLRNSDGHGLTMDVKKPGVPAEKVHINGARGGVPEFPSLPVKPAPKVPAAEPTPRSPRPGEPIPQGPRIPPAEPVPAESPPPPRPWPPVVRPVPVVPYWPHPGGHGGGGGMLEGF